MRYSAQIRQAPCGRRAATLVEILVVMAILLILSTLGFYGYTVATGFGNRLETQTKIAAAKTVKWPDKTKTKGKLVAEKPKDPQNPVLPKDEVGGGTDAQPPGPDGPSEPRRKPSRRIGLMPKAPGGEKRQSQRRKANPLVESFVFNSVRPDGQRSAPFSPARALVSASKNNDLVRSAFVNALSYAAPENDPDLEQFLDGAFVLAPAGNDLVWKTYAASSAFLLHSNPGANHVIYMDFDGHTTAAGNQWNADFNSNNPITAEAWSIDGDRTAFSTAERDKIIELWRMVAEDFMPFNVDVTTEDPGLEALRFTGGGDVKWGMRAVICPTPKVSNGSGTWDSAGGIAYLPSFQSGDDICCWVFNGDSDPNAETSLPITVSHEVGHTLGLSHDGDKTKSAPNDEYYPGHGSGVTSWGPIMGAPFSLNVTQWSRDTYPGANNSEDDVAIISAAANGFGYRPDDYGNTPGSAAALNGPLQAKLKTTYGIIEKDTDVDCFSFNADPGPIKIQIAPLFFGPNLDILAELYDSSGKLLLSDNPVKALDANLNMTLTSPGIYYVKIKGAALLPVTPAGYPTYGSIGSYRITGDVTPMKPTFATFRSLNPQRWRYSPATQIYDGTMTIGNVSKTPLTGTFTIVMTLPDASITVVNPIGVQTGQTYTVTFTGTISPGQPYRFPIALRNPRGVPLLTGQNTFVTDIKSN